jgi:hypothetical protein
VSNGNGNGNNEWMREKLDRVYNAVYGNGQEGLRDRVKTLEHARLSSKEQWALYTALFCGFVNMVASFAPPIVNWFTHKI